MKKKNQLDELIEKEYYARAQGKVINILDIPKLFAYARQKSSEGKDLGEDVQEAVNKLCQPA